MDNMYQQYALEAINAPCVLDTLVWAQTTGRQKFHSQVLCTVPFCSPTNAVLGFSLHKSVCQTAEGHYNSQGARAHSKQKGSEEAGFVQPIFSHLEGVYKDEIRLFSEAHSERTKRNSLLWVCWSTEREFVEISLEILKIYLDNALRTRYGFKLVPERRRFKKILDSRLLGEITFNIILQFYQVHTVK